MTKTFYQTTSVLQSVNSFKFPEDRWIPAKGGGYVRQIPIEVENVPDNAKHLFNCASVTPLPKFEGQNVIVREVLNSRFKNNYAHFLID